MSEGEQTDLHEDEPREVTFLVGSGSIHELREKLRAEEREAAESEHEEGEQ